MKNIFLVLIMIIGISLFAENSVSIKTTDEKVYGTITLSESEYIILDDSFLFLLIESDEYDFTFDGYPEGVVKDGAVVYSDELILSGSISLKEGVAPGEYSINVILGYQTCDEAGICNIPVEISQSMLIEEAKVSPIIPGIALAVFVIAFLAAIFCRKKRKV